MVSQKVTEVESQGLAKPRALCCYWFLVLKADPLGRVGKMVWCQDIQNPAPPTTVAPKKWSACVTVDIQSWALNSLSDRNSVHGLLCAWVGPRRKCVSASQWLSSSALEEGNDMNKRIPLRLLPFSWHSLLCLSNLSGCSFIRIVNYIPMALSYSLSFMGNNS